MLTVLQKAHLFEVTPCTEVTVLIFATGDIVDSFHGLQVNSRGNANILCQAFSSGNCPRKSGEQIFVINVFI